MFAGHFRWAPAMELVKESPPPLIPAQAETQFCPGCLKGWVPASAGTSGWGDLSIIPHRLYGGHRTRD